MVRWPWSKSPQEAQKELLEAQRKYAEIRSELVPETEKTVDRVFRIKEANHLGHTFKKIRRDII